MSGMPALSAPPACAIDWAPLVRAVVADVRARLPGRHDLGAVPQRRWSTAIVDGGQARRARARGAVGRLLPEPLPARAGGRAARARRDSGRRGTSASRPTTAASRWGRWRPSRGAWRDSWQYGQAESTASDGPLSLAAHRRQYVSGGSRQDREHRGRGPVDAHGEGQLRRRRQGRQPRLRARRRGRTTTSSSTWGSRSAGSTRPRPCGSSRSSSRLAAYAEDADDGRGAGRMKFVDEYRDPAAAGQLRRGDPRAWSRGRGRSWRSAAARRTPSSASASTNCCRPSVTLLHGPGCPVCVTPLEMIDQAIAHRRRGPT